ncbi:MAG TPA: PilZ domain-containing protein [Myxococcales bacterium]|nr:PilZ domain-containing protein [Myxococcales bacterium]
MLRHRYDDVEQLRRHLHVVDGATLIFYRDPKLNVTTGATVLIEIAFESSDQTRALRTSVLARAEGQGLWLAIPNTRFHKDMLERGIPARIGRRLATDEMVRLKRMGGSEHLVRLLDLSMGGARIGGGLPASLTPGSAVALTISPPEAGRAPEVTRGRIVWVEDGEAGVKFDRDVESSRVAAGRLFRSLEQPWAQAREIRHLATCCRNGEKVLDPPVPRVRIDGKNKTG